jgi:TRAP-type mannitol/chloroaromatic compound transport system permease small subunit
MDLFQYLFLFLPGMVMFTWLSWDFAAESWDLRESLMTTWRPPAYWYKSVIPLSSALILLQGVAEVLKCFKTLRTGIDYRHRAALSELV